MLKLNRLDVSEVADVTVVRFRDRKITEDRRIDEWALELFSLVDGEHRKKLVVSLSSVDILSSAALGKLITLRKKATARGGQLKLSDICPELSRVFSVTRLDRLFDIEPDEAHAVAAFRAASGDVLGSRDAKIGSAIGTPSSLFDSAILPSTAGASLSKRRLPRVATRDGKPVALDGFAQGRSKAAANASAWQEEKMPYRAAASSLVFWTFLLGVVDRAMGDAETEAQSQVVETVQGPPIDSGFVLLNGRYLPHPYVVGRRGDDLVINEHLIDAQCFARRWGRGMEAGPGMRPEPGMGPGRAMEAGPGPGTGRRLRNEGQASLVRRVEQQLNKDALLIVWDDTARFIPEDNAVFILDILLSDVARETKVQSLIDEGTERITASEWGRIVDSFEPTAELLERVGPLIAECRRVAEENEASHRRLKSMAIFRSRPFKYGVTVAALGLAVVASGTLLSYRPTGRVRWREIDEAGDGVPLVMRNVVLLVLLGVFDLTLTLVAEQAGGFFELNPLGSELAGSPVLLASFKITSLLGACLILVMLRRYRGAQIASWWLCLVCTILTFRWLTYNSMFLA